MNNTEKFAQWMDDLSVTHPDIKFASVVEAFHFYQKVEGNDTLMDEALKRRQEAKVNNIELPKGIEIAAEMLTRAYAEETGEYILLIRCPGKDGSTFSDMRFKGGPGLAGLLKFMAVEWNKEKEVHGFIRDVQTVFFNAINHIQKSMKFKSSSN
jgi:hypothetical protein